MKRSMILCFGFLICIAFPAYCGTVDHGKGWGGMDGNDLLPACQAAVELVDGKNISASRMVDAGRCQFYVTGYLDGFWARDNAPIPNNTSVLCYPEGVNVGQMLRVVVKWLQDHPARLHEPGWSLIFAATHDAFACKPGQQSEH